MKYKIVFFGILVFFIYGCNSIQNIQQVCGDGKCTIDEFDDCKSDCERKCYYQDNDFKCTDGWLLSYNEQLKKDDIDNDFIEEDKIFDYSSKEIKDILVFTVGSTYSPKDATEKIAKWTFENINYNTEVMYYDCFEKSASQVVKEKEATCSTQGKVNIAALRLIGVASRGVTGCIKIDDECQSFSIANAKKLPKLGKSIKRNGFIATTGQLHAWTQVYITNNEKNAWLNLENTIGELYSDINTDEKKLFISESCANYLLYETNPTDANFCGYQETIPFVNSCLFY